MSGCVIKRPVSIYTLYLRVTGLTESLSVFRIADWLLALLIAFYFEFAQDLSEFISVSTTQPLRLTDDH